MNDLKKSLLKRIDVLTENEAFWLKKLRLNSMDNFFKTEFKGKNESPIEKHYLKIKEFDFSHFKAGDNLKLEFNNLKFFKEKGIELLSLEKAIELYPIESKKLLIDSFNLIKRKETFFHFALFDNSFFLFLPERVSLEKELTVFVNSMNSSNYDFFPFFTVLLNNSKLKLNIVFQGKNTVLSSSFNSLIKDNALLSVDLIQNISSKAFFSFNNLFLEKKSNARLSTFDFNSELSISTQNVVLKEKDCKASSFNSFVLNEKQQYEIEANAFHLKGSNISNVLSKGILFNESNAFFKGSIVVEKNSFKADSSLESKALLLSNKAKMNALPVLEIKTNDVKAKHSNSVNSIPSTELFYLMSRGLTKKQAEQLIISGFIESIPKNSFSSKELKELISKKFKMI